MKYLLILLFYFFTILVSKAQIIQSLGIKSGISIANQTWHYESINLTLKKDYRVGFYSVASLNFLNSKHFNITTDIGYCQKGNKEKIPNTSTTMPEGDGTYTVYDTKFNYFTLSPMFKIKHASNPIMPYYLIGIRLDRQLSYRSDFDLQQLENYFHKTLFGLTGGAGVEYKINNIGINTEFQYHYDISKVLNTPFGIATSERQIKNNAFIISAGIKYYLHKSTKTE